MDPVVWSQTIVGALEQKGVVGAILPLGASDASDRYQPNRVFASYQWSGELSARTRVEFVIKPSRSTGPTSTIEGEWSLAVGGPPPRWPPGFETVTVEKPRGPPQHCTQDFALPNRFRVRVTIDDDRVTSSTYSRRVTLQNLRQTGGTLLRVRIVESDFPEIVPMRIFGTGDDIYYRAGGLIGTYQPENRELSFQPHALLPEPIRRPLIGAAIEDSVRDGILDERVARLARSQGIRHLFKFQEESVAKVGHALSNPGSHRPILLTGGTAAGKTEAFLFPLLARLVDDRQYRGIQGLFVYPTKALAADQARRMFVYLSEFNVGRSNPLSIGLLDGDTPFDENEVEQREVAGTLFVPFSECPKQGCDGTVRFKLTKEGSRVASPTCARCGATFPWLRLSRRTIQDRWPHFLLTNPDMLQRRVSDTFAYIGQTWLGRLAHFCQACGKYSVATPASTQGRRSCACGAAFQPAESLSPAMIVFDEAHLFKGLFGSQVAILLARLGKISGTCGHHPLLIGASATIASPIEFGHQLFGTDVDIIEGRDELRPDEEPTRFHLFLMPVQVSVLNAVGHVLGGSFLADHNAGEVNRVLVFSDSKRTVYQLEASLPEFYASIRGSELPADWPTPATRSHTGDHSKEQRRVVEQAFNSRELRVLLATQTLEVGVDFAQLQLEIQTGATYSYNDYIQRVGRAGRKGVPALVICILRPQVPLDYYYYEHCRELVQFSPEALDEIPLRADNPFLVERHAPSAALDFLIGVKPAAGLLWDPAAALGSISAAAPSAQAYLESVFIKPHSWDSDLLREAIRGGLSRVRLALRTPRAGERSVMSILAPMVPLTLRASDIPVPVESDDFDRHRGISIAGELLEGEEAEEEEPEESEGDHT